MSTLEYHKPKTVEEALGLLDRGIPLAGGTAITPRRSKLQAVIDLCELHLDGLEIHDNVVHTGSMLTLQTVVESEDYFPEALRTACRQEAGWNLRNAATLGGHVMTADGRSPLLTVLLALHSRVALEPGGEVIPLEELLAQRSDATFHRLITCLHLPQPLALAYQQVARSPMDRPMVCAAAAKFPAEGTESKIGLALGGFGEKPVRVIDAEAAFEDGGGINAAVEAASAVFVDANDAWASAEYRAHVAGVLAQRVISEVIG